MSRTNIASAKSLKMHYLSSESPEIRCLSAWQKLWTLVIGQKRLKLLGSLNSMCMMTLAQLWGWIWKVCKVAGLNHWREWIMMSSGSANYQFC